MYIAFGIKFYKQNLETGSRPLLLSSDVLSKLPRGGQVFNLELINQEKKKKKKYKSSGVLNLEMVK